MRLHHDETPVRRRRRAGAVLLATLLLVGAAGRPARAGTDLDSLAERRLPWRAELVGMDPDDLVLDRGWVQSVLSVQRGDTTVRYHARNPGVVRTRIAPALDLVDWQHNLAPAYCGRTPCASLEGVWDADGDGDDDLVLCAAADDRSHWLVQAIDDATGDLVAEFTLPAGPDRRGDGGWDGLYSVVGVTDVPGAHGPRRAFLVVATAGFDREPRGVMAVDPSSGETLWTDFTGAKPEGHQAAAADLDGDGRDDVVYAAPGVDNLGGQVVNGLSDDACMIVAVGGDGARLWTRRFDQNVTGHLAVADADGDGGPDVIVALSGRSYAHSLLAVLDGATGRSIAETGLGTNVRRLAVAPTGGGLDIYLGAQMFGIRKYRFDGDLRLQATAASTIHPALLDVLDVLPAPGAEVFAADDGGGLYVLDAGLRPLAYFRDPRLESIVAGLQPWAMANGTPAVLAQGSESGPGARIVLLPNPRAVPWGALSLLPVAGGAAWYVRRRRRGTSAATRRELRLQLLGRLELSGHGAIGALRSLRRLVWLLDARAQAAAASPDLDARLEGLLAECRDHMLPDLAGTLELAQLAACEAAVTGQARAIHGRVARLLQAGPGAARDQELREAAFLLEGAFVALRREVEADFRADLAAVVARVLAAHADAAAVAGVTVRTAGLDEPAWCRGDADELVFVVDNLVENALRAMVASTRRELDLSVRRDDNLILLQVRDTGCGIAPDDWEVVLETGASTREGGGLGLPESRRRLRKHGASLAVTASEAGAGTTLTLSVAPARARENS